MYPLLILAKCLNRLKIFLRYSVDGNKTVLKFIGETPTFLVGLQQYNHSEILAIMATPEWYNED